jgi:hypothetical protein
MVRICIFAVITAVVLVSSLGCGQQGAGNTPSGSTEQAATSPRESREPPTTTPEETTSEETTVLSGLECPNGNWVSGTIDYVVGAKGEKGNLVEVARRDFSKHIKEGDTVEIADRSRGRNAKATVRVIRDGRVVALIDYRRAGGGWLRDYYEACGSF